MTKNNEATQKLFGSPQLLREELRTLVVGDIRRWKARGYSLPDVQGMFFITYEALDGTALKDITPDLILSPLMQDEFGALEIAARLQDLKFKGRYRAVSEALPNAGMIRAEVARAAPDIDFDLIGLPVGPYAP